MTPTTAYWLYFLFALGGIGVYLLMPKAGRPQGLAGGVLGVLALVGLMFVLGMRIVTPDAGTAYFYLFAAIAVVSASRVITHPRPVYSALYFVLSVIAVAAMIVLLQAEFLAIALVIIYAGAILVTYLFVIMLAQQTGSPTYDRRSREPFWSVLAGFVLMAAIAGRAGDLPEVTAPPSAVTQSPERGMGRGLLARTDGSTPENVRALASVRTSARAQAGGSLASAPPETGNAPAAMASSEDDATEDERGTGNTLAIGSLIMTRHVVALQLAGVLLLVSMVGAIALSRKRVPADVPAPPRAPLGRIGKEVKPF